MEQRDSVKGMKKNFIMFFLFCILNTAFSAEGEEASWIPPSSIDPIQISNQAVTDRLAGRFADSLSKHVWFHEHALKLDPSLIAVRNSYAINSWFKLCDVYPPARVKLTQTRDLAEEKVLDSDFTFFDDVVLLNTKM